MVTGDEELIRRALENVIRNAIRYAPRGTAVDIELAKFHDTAMVSVRDYGPGVPDEELTRIFDPFYRVDSDRNRSSGGLGLGLAIARRSVQLHKGKLSAQNAHPGLLVTMEFPIGLRKDLRRLRSLLRRLLRFQQLEGGRQNEQVVGSLLVVHLDGGRENLVHFLAVAVALDGERPLHAIADIPIFGESGDLFVPIFGDRVAAEETLPDRNFVGLIEINRGSVIVGIGQVDDLHRPVLDDIGGLWTR